MIKTPDAIGGVKRVRKPIEELCLFIIRSSIVTIESKDLRKKISDIITHIYVKFTYFIGQFMLNKHVLKGLCESLACVGLNESLMNLNSNIYI